MTCRRPYVMWCWHVIVNRQSADGYDYHKLYGPLPPAEQTIRTTSLKRGFIDQDLWRQGHTKTGTQRFSWNMQKFGPRERWVYLVMWCSFFISIISLDVSCFVKCNVFVLSCLMFTHYRVQSVVHLSQFRGKMVPSKLTSKSNSSQSLQSLQEIKLPSKSKDFGGNQTHDL